MTRPWQHSRREAYSTRAHDVATRPLEQPAVVWWRGERGDHAFGTGGSGFMRSRCAAVRWTTRMTLVEGTVSPCTDCLAAIAAAAERDPAIISESELRLLDGNR